MFSAEARLLFAPKRVYRQLADRLDEERHPRAWILVRRPLLWLFVVAAFISFITAGRWVWFHIVAAMAMWSFVPLYQLLFVTWIARLLKSDRPLHHLIDLFFAGQGAWYVFFLLISGLCIFSPEVWPTFQVLMSSGALIAVFLGTIVWSVLITYAFFRAGLGLTAGKAILGSGLFYLFFDGTIAAYYLLTGQLYPLLVGIE